MPAYTFVAAGAVTNNGAGTSVTPAMYAGAAAGQLALAIIEGRTAGMTVTTAPSSDWVQIFSYTTNGSIFVYATVVTESTVAPTVDLSGTQYTSGVVLGFSGDVNTDLGTLLHSSGTVASSAASSMPLADISPTEDDCLLIAIVRKDKTTTSDGLTLSQGTYTERVESVPNGTAQSTWIGSQQQTTATARTSQTVTQTGTTESIKYNAVTLALRTQAAAGSAPVVDTVTNPMTDGAGFTISGAFSASGNTLFIGGVSHTIGTQNATTITGTLALGVRQYGSADVVVRNSSGQDSAATSVQLLPSASYEYTTIVVPYPASNRPETTSVDVEAGDQMRISSPSNTTLAGVALDSGGGIELDPTNEALSASIFVEVNDGTGWGTGDTITFAASTPGPPNTTRPREQRRARQRRWLNSGR